MGEIRPFEASHLPAVAALQQKVIRRREPRNNPALEQYFSSIFLENPWRSDDLPSLVYLHEGKAVGFLGVVPREMEWNGRPIRVAVASQFMVDRDQVRGVPGLEILKRFFAGPQDLSYTDGATEAAFLCWTSLGARAAPLYALEWTRILKPARYLGGLFKEKGGIWNDLARAVTPAAILFDAALALVPLRSAGAPKSDCSVDLVSAEKLFETIADIGWRDPLKPVYEPASFRWLIDQAASAQLHGELRLGVVREPGGQNAGWFVYFAKPGGVSVVLQLGARPRAFDSVLLALLADAWNQGSAALRGQALPRHLTSLTTEHCGFRHIGSGVLAHARDRALLDTILRGDAALSRLDGEWWMRFSIDPLFIAGTKPLSGPAPQVADHRAAAVR
jgi:hypothetical protein